MNIELRSTSVTVSPALHEHVVHRIELALRRFAPRVHRIVVRLIDLNGPKGGIDKRCRIVAALDPRGTIVVQCDADDVYVAATHAAALLDERIGRLVRKRHHSTDLAAE